MHVLSCKINNLINLSGEEISKKMQDEINRNPKLKSVFNQDLKENNVKELISWENSIPRLISVIKDANLTNLHIVLEYIMPVGGNRIDAVLIGYDKTGSLIALIVELKQWASIDEDFVETDCKVRLNKNNKLDLRWHPVLQTETYKKILTYHHSHVDLKKITIETCQYLHNFEQKQSLFSNQYKLYEEISTNMFCKGEEKDFQSFLQNLFSQKPISQEYKIFTEGEYILSKVGFNSLDKVLKGEKFVALLDEQRPIYTTIKQDFRKYKESQTVKQVIIISGLAGTGKSILGMELLRSYIAMTKKRKCYFTVTSRTLREIIWGYTKIKNITTYDIINLSQEHLDLIVVDEAHRLDNIYENMKIMLKKFKVIILLQDDMQRISFKEQGTKENLLAEIIKIEQSENIIVDTKTYELNTQQRAIFDSNYVALLKEFLEGKKSRSTNLKSEFKVNVINSLENLNNIMEKNSEKINAMWIAPYCWIWTRNERNMDIQIKDGSYLLKKAWNPINNQFDWYENRSRQYLSQVGCVYTTQGLSFSKTALIFGKDLIWRNGEWKVDLTKIKDPKFISDIVKKYNGRLINYNLKDNDETWKVQLNDSNQIYTIGEFLRETNADKDVIKQLIKNIYFILMTRSTEQIYLWFEDEETKSHFQEFFQVEAS